MQKNPSKQLGFTLMELMVTVAIAAIVMGLAIPSFSNAIKNNRLTTVANDFVTTLNFARSEAIKRGFKVRVCKSNDGAACVVAGDWARGWIVFADQDNDDVFDAGEAPPLRVQVPSQPQVTMIGAGVVANAFSYASDGRAISTGTTGLTPIGGGNAIQVCDERIGNIGKNIIINTLGRPSIQAQVACP